jgi:hypothetical protein
MYPSGDRTRIQVQELCKCDDPKCDWDTVDDSTHSRKLGLPRSRLLADEILNMNFLSRDMWTPCTRMNSNPVASKTAHYVIFNLFNGCSKQEGNHCNKHMTNISKR